MSTRLAIGVGAGVAGSAIGRRDASVLDGSFAYSLGGAGDEGIRVCAYAQTSYIDGPNASDYKHRELNSAIGLSIGRALRVDRVTFVPVARIGALESRVTDGFPSRVFGDLSFGSFRRVLGEVGVGLGLRFGEQVVLTPSYRRPFGSGSPYNADEPIFSVAARFGVF